jgi:hypothetical protein
MRSGRFSSGWSAAVPTTDDFRAEGAEIHLGIEVRWDASIPGTRRFYVSDNVGNRLQFIAPNAG